MKKITFDTNDEMILKILTSLNCSDISIDRCNYSLSIFFNYPNNFEPFVISKHFQLTSTTIMSVLANPEYTHFIIGFTAF